MNFAFRQHRDLEGLHAFLSASKYAWLRYDEAKLLQTYEKHMNTTLGTRLHALAKEMIELGVKAQASNKTFNKYVNDCIGFRMAPEVILAYSFHIFGTADAVSYTKAPKDLREAGLTHILRIFDLKNGETPAKMDQLLIYAAIFFLEYNVDPRETMVELRIYQNDEITVLLPELQDILDVMEKIVTFDRILDKVKDES